jgi:hypothetical protein
VNGDVEKKESKDLTMSFTFLSSPRLIIPHVTGLVGSPCPLLESLRDSRYEDI